MAFPLQTADGADIGANESLSHPALLARLAGPNRTPSCSALASTGKKVMFRRWKPKPPPTARSPCSTPRRRRDPTGRRRLISSG